MHLAAYYFRAHMYTLVPRHVREDLDWMADLGTTAVCLAVLEQDLVAARSNIALVGDEAARRGMRLFAVPSRWGGLCAGAPKVPSQFAACHPETWVLKNDGAPAFSSVSGPTCSVHHPATAEFFTATLERLFAVAPFSGVVWDEPKNLGLIDASPAARQALGARWADPAAHRDAHLSFLGECSRQVHRLAPEALTSLFTFADSGPDLIAAVAATPHQDAIGCDGRPWGHDDGGTDDNGQGRTATKLLLPHGAAWTAAAAAHGRQSLFLIENHALADRDLPLVDRRLPEVLALKPDWLYYYYYPRDVASPDAAMAILARHLRRR